MKSKPSVTLPAAFITLSADIILLDPASHAIVATDGEAIAIRPLPDSFTGGARRVPVGNEAITIAPDSGEPTPDTYDLTALETVPAYRIALNPAKLFELAKALDSPDRIVVEFPASPDLGPIKVLPDPCGIGTGYLMPQPCPHGTEGLLAVPGAGISQELPPSAPVEKPAAVLPPPVILATVRKETRYIEVSFGGIPDKDTLKEIGREGIGFSYSGKGTKKGVPEKVWYAPDNEWFRSKITELLKVGIQQAAA